MTINENQNRIIKTFESLNDWFDRYEYLVKLGKEHAPEHEKVRTEENLLNGCQSGVWIYKEVREGKVFYKGDSDSVIIRGILVLLMEILSDNYPIDIVNADLYFVKEIGLNNSLSPVRKDGMSSIIKQMKTLARNCIYPS
ncbi:Sulfur acceptor protein SufE for iron-sulfur cluster assembly [Chitinispirillum alkaliphilum]|nr:Sulfur acceptor protein SufE for iron-sulfur cluster assembly [Chitinispirillum alkaliphilum]